MNKNKYFTQTNNLMFRFDQLSKVDFLEISNSHQVMEEERIKAILHALAASEYSDNKCSSQFRLSFTTVSNQLHIVEEETSLADFDNPFQTSSITTINIGGLTKERKKSTQPEFVPFRIIPYIATICSIENQDVVKHLRWMLQKDSLKQDMFLLGPPGPLKRWLALLYCQLVGREVEYLSLSRDTTESDLKQRYTFITNYSQSTGVYNNK